jgi:SOS-response transcriptional repressor LexA
MARVVTEEERSADGRYLYWLRTKVLDIKQEAMADLLRVKRTTYANYEKSSRVPEAVMRSARAMAPPSEEIGGIREARPRAKVEMPLYSAVPASQWEEPDDTEDTEEVDAKFAGPGRFLARIKGDSMYPFLHPGDIAVFERTDSPALNRVILAQCDCGVTVKQYRSEGNRAVLRALNRDHADCEAESWECLAVLIGIIRIEDGTEITFFNRHGLSPRSPS